LKWQASAKAGLLSMAEEAARFPLPFGGTIARFDAVSRGTLPWSREMIEPVWRADGTPTDGFTSFSFERNARLGV